MAKTICWFQYTKRNRSWDGDKDGKALMNNGKLKKQNRCKTCEQQKRLYKMDIQAKLYVTQNIWQRLSRNI